MYASRLLSSHSAHIKGVENPSSNINPDLQSAFENLGIHLFADQWTFMSSEELDAVQRPDIFGRGHACALGFPFETS